MFPFPYFAARYFPARYWPKSGTIAVEGAPSASFEIRERGAAFACERRGMVFERVTDLSIFAPNPRGAVFESPTRGAIYFVEEL